MIGLVIPGKECFGQLKMPFLLLFDYLLNAFTNKGFQKRKR